MQTVRQHIAALLIAILGVISILILSIFWLNSLKTTQLKVSGKALRFGGRIINYGKGNQSELDFVASLRNKSAITLMGSSEFSDDPNCSYFYLPDSLNIPVIGVGHAYHQSFSIFCELLAHAQDLKDAKICIVFSPGWIEANGTNIEAFLEFVPSNFLQKIAHDENLPVKYKIAIGHYIDQNYDLISSPTKVLDYFKNYSKYQNVPVVSSFVSGMNKSFNDVNYTVKGGGSNQVRKRSLPKDYSIRKKQVKKEFLASIQSNDLFISDDYFNTYLKSTGKYTPGYAAEVDPASNQELQDFYLLVDLLKRYKVDASFVIQPLNPHHYINLDKLNPTMDAVIARLKQENIPFYNLYAHNIKEYEPGLLKDVMHIGVYGWMGINEYLMEKYEK